MASSFASMATGRKALVASESTSTLGAESCKVSRFGDKDLGISMSWTAELQRFAGRILRSQHSENLSPHGNLGVRLDVSNKIHSVLSSA
jgi:hypothetical protein